MGLKAINPLIKKAVVKKAYVAPEVRTLESLGLKMEQLTSDVMSLSLKTKTLVPEGIELFSWSTRRPKLTFGTIDPNSLCMVHMTKYFPKDGIIRSEKVARKISEGVSGSRSTIHFSLNASVKEHAHGDAWATMDYAIITPFADTIKKMKQSKVIGGLMEDFYVLDEVVLPKGAVIVKHNPNIPKGQLAISEAFEGIKLVETSNRNTGEIANMVVEKMGYTQRKDAAKEFLNASDKELSQLARIASEGWQINPEVMSSSGKFKSYIDHLDEMGGIKEIKKRYEDKLKMLTEESDPFGDIEESLLKELENIKLVEKFKDKMIVYEKAWPEFCSRNNLYVLNHSVTPWATTESIVSTIPLIEEVNNNSWGIYKDKYIMKLLEAKKSLPKGKKLGIDIDKVIMIIKNSDTPKTAKDTLKQELGIQAMHMRDGFQINNKSELYEALSNIDLV